MSDPFRKCGAVNAAGFACWLAGGHRGVHETHPANRGLSREAGAEPVWSDAVPPAPSPDREDSPAHDAHSATFITAVQERHPGLEVGLISEPED